MKNKEITVNQNEKIISLNLKVLLPVVAGFIMFVFVLLFVSYSQVRRGMIAYFNKELALRMPIPFTAMTKMQDDMQNNLAWFKESARAVSAIRTNNAAVAVDLAKTGKIGFNLTNVVFLNTDGIVIGSADSVYKAGENLSENPAVSAVLLRGNFLGNIVSGEHITVTAGTTVIAGTETVGIVLLEKAIDNAVLDDFKNQTNMEFTVFLGNKRIATTLVDKDGKRMIGTKLDNNTVIDTVINNRLDYKGVVEIGGVEYITAYQPFVDYRSDVVGMIFMGISLEHLSETISIVLGTLIPTMLVCCAILFAVLFFLLRFVVIVPLKKANTAIHNLTSGDADLTYEIEIKRNDEIGKLGKDVNKFIRILHELISNLKKEQDTVGIISDKLTKDSQQAASAIAEIMANIQGVRTQTEKQNKSIEITSKVLNEEVHNIKQLDTAIESQRMGIMHSSSAIEQMLGNISSVSASIQKMAHQFKSLIETSDDGKTKQMDVDARVKQIAEQSRLLLEANSVISKIASQTNLLAMNAAIEAAHAGSSGAGFSVVADEIRSLAETSSAQSKTIGAELKRITKSIDAVVTSSGASQKAFFDMSEKLSLTNSLVVQIDNAMREQQEASNQVLMLLRDMNKTSGDVDTLAKALDKGISSLQNEIEQLTQIAAVVFGSMDEMGIGAGEINNAAQSVSHLAHETDSNIRKMNELINKFKV